MILLCKSTLISHLRLAAVSICALLLSVGCATAPSVSFYSLGDTSKATAESEPLRPPFYIKVMPIEVPPQDRRVQFVVQTHGNEVLILEQTRWASLPADEIRGALSSDLTSRLGAIDLGNLPLPDGLAVFRVNVIVRSFDSKIGSFASLDAAWTVQDLGRGKTKTCHSHVDQPVGSDVESLVAGHRMAVDRLAEAIAHALNGLRAGVSSECFDPLVNR